MLLPPDIRPPLLFTPIHAADDAMCPLRPYYIWRHCNFLTRFREYPDKCSVAGKVTRLIAKCKWVQASSTHGNLCTQNRLPEQHRTKPIQFRFNPLKTTKYWRALAAHL